MNIFLYNFNKFETQNFASLRHYTFSIFFIPPLPHAGHFIYIEGLPFAPDLTPPISQMLLSFPQSQVNFHSFDSALIFSNFDLEEKKRTNFCDPLKVFSFSILNVTEFHHVGLAFL